MSLGAATAALFVLPFADHLIVIILLPGLFEYLVRVLVVNAYIVDVMPQEIQGTGNGLVRTVCLLLALISPVVMGWLGDAGLLDAAFLLLGVIACLALVTCWVLLEPKHIE